MSDTKLHNLVKFKINAIGFRSDKKFVYYRMRDGWFQIILIDRTSSPGEFRLCSAIRMFSSTFPAIVLNGMVSDVVNDGLRYKARICYARISPTIEECADRIIDLSNKILLPWLSKYQSIEQVAKYTKHIGASNVNDISQESKNVLGLKSAQQADAPEPLTRPGDP